MYCFFKLGKHIKVGIYTIKTHYNDLINTNKCTMIFFWKFKIISAFFYFFKKYILDFI